MEFKGSHEEDNNNNNNNIKIAKDSVNALAATKRLRTRRVRLIWAMLAVNQIVWLALFLLVSHGDCAPVTGQDADDSLASVLQQQQQQQQPQQQQPPVLNRVRRQAPSKLQQLELNEQTLKRQLPVSVEPQQPRQAPRATMTIHSINQGSAARRREGNWWPVPLESAR
jgi:hypothetical protein